MRTSTRGHWESFWKKRHAVDEVYSNGDRIVRNLQKVTKLDGLRVLEVGAGTGRDSFPLAQCGARVVQLDYSVQSLAILRGLAAQQNIPVEIVGGDTFSLPFRDDSFDVVFHQGLLEHFREPAAQKLLEENIRVLRPGGLLLVDVPQRYHAYTVAKRILIAAGRWFAGWERSFTIGEQELKCLLEKRIPGIDLSAVRSILEWVQLSYAVDIEDNTSLQTCFSTNRSYFGLRAPMQKVDNGLVPDFQARYLGGGYPLCFDCNQRHCGTMRATDPAYQPNHHLVTVPHGKNLHGK